MVRKKQRTQMSDNCKIRLKERLMSESCFSRDGTILATTPRDAAESPLNGQVDDQSGPFSHATPSAEMMTASARFVSFSPAHGPTRDSDEESDSSTDTSSGRDDLTASIH